MISKRSNVSTKGLGVFLHFKYVSEKSGHFPKNKLNWILSKLLGSKSKYHLSLIQAIPFFEKIALFVQRVISPLVAKKWVVSNLISTLLISLQKYFKFLIESRSNQN